MLTNTILGGNISECDEETSQMRECWNWQTGMTKDHVSVGSVGSSPISRTFKATEEVRWLLSYPDRANEAMQGTAILQNVGLSDT